MTWGSAKTREIPHPQPQSNTFQKKKKEIANVTVSLWMRVFTEGNGVQGPTALGGSGPVVWLKYTRHILWTSLTISLHWGTRSCLMPFEQPQTFKKSYSARKKQKKDQTKRDGRRKSCRTSNSLSCKRWETFVWMSVNSSACLIHDQHLFCEVLSPAGWRHAFLIMRWG